MLSVIVRFSLYHRFVVIFSSFLLLGFSVYHLQNATYDVFPEFAPPQVIVETEAPGFSSEQVETLVTQIIEQAVGGAGGIATMRSSSIQGLSAVQINFNLSSDIYKDRQMIGERLADVANKLPAGVNAPVMTPLSSTTDIVTGIALTSDTLNSIQLRTLADWQLRPRILSVDGVSDAESYGGLIRQIQIRMKPDALIRYGLSFDDVINAAKRATGVRSGGVIDTEDKRIIINASPENNPLETIRQTPLIKGSAESLTLNITLGDIADVTEGSETPYSAASIIGKSGVLLLVSSQYGSNTLDVTRRVEAALTELRPALEKQGVTLRSDIIRPASFVEKSVANVNHALLIGAVLVIAVLFLFLHNWRGALISALAIPFSLIIAAALLSALGYTLNTMTLGGLAIAVGLVVDDAIIDVENMLRRLRNAPQIGNKESVREDLLLDASLEVRAPIIFATLAVILISAPIILMPGLAGRFFAPLGVAYAISTLLSLMVALTLTPALCMVLLKTPRAHVPAMTRWLQTRYIAVLGKIESRPALLYILVCILTLSCGVVAMNFKTAFLPELHEGHFILHMESEAGTSLDESIRQGNKVTEAIKALPFVDAVVQQVGRTERGIDVWGTNISEFNIALKPLKNLDETIAKEKILEITKQFHEQEFEVSTFLSERVQEVISGYTSDAALNIYGDDLDKLDQIAAQQSTLLKAIPGVKDVQTPAAPGMPQTTLTLNQTALRKWGLDTISVLDAVHSAYQGEIVSQVYDQIHPTDVVVMLGAGRGQSSDSLKDIPILTPSGQYVNLGTLATLEQKPGRYMTLRDAGRRVQTISFNIDGNNKQAVLQTVKDKIASENLPAGIYTSLQSLTEEAIQSRHTLIITTCLASVAILILLSLVMRHPSQLALIMINAPLALIGGIIAVVLNGNELSLGAMVGFITLLGITLRNSVLLLSHYSHAVNVEGKPWNLETILQASTERLLPILMTALVTGIGLLPIALGSGEPGREIEGPMALVILGGLFTSTLLTLGILPSLAWRYGEFTLNKA
jgi:CzcA family heavy metal efflux pump